MYSVKSGYQLLCELDDQNRASGLDMSSMKAFWRRLWKMKVPNKIKKFLWHACSEALHKMQLTLEEGAGRFDMPTVRY